MASFGKGSKKLRERMPPVRPNLGLGDVWDNGGSEWSEAHVRMTKDSGVLVFAGEDSVEWTLFVARSGLVQFPEEPGKYARALQQHKDRQRETRQKLEDRLTALQAEVRSLVSIHRPWRCIEADFTEFPAPELTAALSSRSVDIGTIKFPAPEAMGDDTIYVTPTQLARLREIVSELKSDEVQLDLKPLDDTVCAA